MALREGEVYRVPIARVMTRAPATVEEAAPVADAAAEMAAGGFRHVPVVDGRGRLVGMISERDLRGRLGSEPERFAHAAADALAAPVSEVMTPDPIALLPGAPLADAIRIFADERVGAVPVVDGDDRPVGILSYVDLLRTLRDLSEIVARREKAQRPEGSAAAKVAAKRPAGPRRRRPGPRGAPATGGRRAARG